MKYENIQQGNRDDWDRAAYETQFEVMTASLRQAHDFKMHLLREGATHLKRIAELEARVQELGQIAKDCNTRRVIELEAQLAAVGAGGVSALRPTKCLHQIAEPPAK